MKTKILLWILPSLLATLLVMLGYWVGRYSVINQFSVELARYQSTETLANVLDSPAIKQGLTDRQKNDYYQAYSKGEVIKEQVGEISWGVKNVLTPFVGNAPWPGQQFNASINGLQFRNAVEPVMPKPDKTYRVFITGGSTAYGAGAPNQEATMGALLEQRLQQQLAASTGLHYEVFTFANPAWASTHERIAIENRLVDLAPDLIISFSGNNDVFWASMGKNIFWFRTFADDFFRQLVNTAYRLSGEDEMPDVVTISSQPIAAKLVADRLSKNVQLAAYSLHISDADAAYVFALQPTLAVTKKTLTPREQDFIDANQDYFQQAYLTIDNELLGLSLANFQYLNLATVFDDKHNEDIFIDSFHFADKGNRIIAEALFNGIFLPQ